LGAKLNEAPAVDCTILEKENARTVRFTFPYSPRDRLRAFHVSTDLHLLKYQQPPGTSATERPVERTSEDHPSDSSTHLELSSADAGVIVAPAH